ncbi:hypothetical protein EHQ53_12480 [Leptospira langatensis]|uniref:Uncharacterized protein n=1 Tax=Leptospira langatensis TaxID=2484983 RepID=A0A5F1ZSD6_9LEPT|nr:hypothetical protein [Leptospira langatensis]TGK02796.1 hypothetical protein EHO57_05630 [Leptospira langatensis]TGL39999.1 hypothetical protein EHQ53_12480 [Leptospira langatensis]
MKSILAIILLIFTQHGCNTPWQQNELKKKNKQNCEKQIFTAFLLPGDPSTQQQTLELALLGLVACQNSNAGNE